MFEEKRARSDCLPSFNNSHSLTMFEENQVTTFQQFMEKKEGQLDQISKVKSLERRDRFMKKKKKNEMVKVIVVSK